MGVKFLWSRKLNLGYNEFYSQKMSKNEYATSEYSMRTVKVTCFECGEIVERIYVLVRATGFSYYSGKNGCGCMKEEAVVNYER